MFYSRLKETNEEGCTALADLFHKLPDKTKSIIAHIRQWLAKNNQAQQILEMVTPTLTSTVV